jgi:hypothetical protein
VKVIAAFAAVQALFKPRYRPEAHYMRGPGPACAAKRRMREAEEAARHDVSHGAEAVAAR